MAREAAKGLRSLPSRLARAISPAVATIAPSLALVVLLAAPVSLADEALQKTLSFEVPHEGDAPRGWGGGPPETLFVDDEIVHRGEWAARLERDADSSHGFSALTKSLPTEVAGQAIELRGFLRLEGVVGWAGLWMREDGEAGAVAFENMQGEQLSGTIDWTEYRIRLPLKEEARTVFFGALLAGEGRVWVDDLQLLVDGRPISDAPKRQRPKTVLDTDREFDSGSRIETTELTPEQLSNLVLLGQVWGFLKYHHPEVTAGKRHWDYELFRVLPGILAATNRPAAQAVLRQWIEGLGPLSGCDPCAKPPEGAHLPPDIDWIRDPGSLGTGLSALLQDVHRHRPADGGQFYVSLVEGIGNPRFAREKGYADLKTVDTGYRILALFRFWNIIRYWFPYRDVIGEDWDAVLAEFLPRLVAAEPRDQYEREVLRLVVRVRDGHANLRRAETLRPPQGDCQLPVRLRFVEDRAVVVGYLGDDHASGLKLGDVVTGLGERTVESMIADWLPWYAGSNRVAQRLALAGSLTRGSCGEVDVGIEREGRPLEATARRLPLDRLGTGSGPWPDLPGETFQLLSDEIAYLKLSSVKSRDAAEYIRRADGTRGLIVDIRGYPAEFVVFALGQHLVEESTPFARFTHGDLSNPGAFLWTPPVSLSPEQPFYRGTIVVLVDEHSMSQAEYTAMAFRAAPGAVVVGSTTAGADGNVSPIPLPGGLQTMISGIGVFYPDKEPTQRVGIVPDVEARPSVQGIREGRDEVLEAAVRQILGAEADDERIREITGR